MAPMPQPTMMADAVTIAAARPRELARFYANLLGWEVSTEEPARPGKPPEDGWAQVTPPSGVSGLTLNFEFDDYYRRPVWPSVEGLQSASQHLDIGVQDLNAAVAWLPSKAPPSPTPASGRGSRHARSRRSPLLPLLDPSDPAVPQADGPPAHLSRKGNVSGPR